ncbi:phage terminase small subunit P27 family [Rosistilla oblonga]|uniref:Phage terminase, small subunit n=1 Tax=Rosistilla oblonga TaxID=2527990 RepID=A0A518ITT7_9BACT|nr:phage terminase small subunit P27 family [Rosistilla oblonga]QDV56502.1 Phage terminase, small subunit [Rosistilla oblonga]
MPKKKATTKPRPGTKRGRPKGATTKQPANTASEKALAAVPKPPAYLGKYAKEYWVTVGPVLIEAKLLTNSHLGAFAALCEAWHEYRTNQDWITANPDKLTFATETGYVAEDPRIRFRNKALDTLQKLWSKFGMTPKALADLGKLTDTKSSIPAIAIFARSKYDDLEK